jgi:hypothetical protein
MKTQTVWRIRSTMGWGVVGMSAAVAGLGIWMIWRVLDSGAPTLLLIEPTIFLVFAVWILRTAFSFLDRRRSGLSE